MRLRGEACIISKVLPTIKLTYESAFFKLG